MDCTRRLEAIIAKPGNRFCADCDAKNPRWVSINLGVFVCMRCCGFHRKLGVHISKMKSVTLDRWTPDMMRVIEQADNEILNAYLEKGRTEQKPTESASAYVVENFIRTKYERRSWADRTRNDPASEIIAGTFAKAPVVTPEPPRPREAQAQPVQPPSSALLIDLLADDHVPSGLPHSHSAPPTTHHSQPHDIWHQPAFKMKVSPAPLVTLASVQFAPAVVPPIDSSSARQENIARVMSMYQSLPPPSQQSQQFQPLGALAAQSMMQHGYPYYSSSQWPSF
jgi:hypothetical protein